MVLLLGTLASIAVLAKRKSPARKGRSRRAFSDVPKAGEASGHSGNNKHGPWFPPRRRWSARYCPAGGRGKVMVISFWRPLPLVPKLALCDWPLPPIRVAVTV
jgi:hypothetical protein